MEKDKGIECEESDARVEVLPVGEGVIPLAKVMIFMPRLVLVLAGMKRVVWWLGAGMDMRLGWLELAQGLVSCAPVLYS